MIGVVIENDEHEQPFAICHSDAFKSNLDVLFHFFNLCLFYLLSFKIPNKTL